MFPARSNDDNSSANSFERGDCRPSTDGGIKGQDTTAHNGVLSRFHLLQNEVCCFNHLGIQLFRQGRFGAALFHFNEAFQLTTTLGGDILDNCTEFLHSTSETRCGGGGPRRAAAIPEERKVGIEYDMLSSYYINKYESMFESRPAPPSDFMDPLWIIEPDSGQKAQDMADLTTEDGVLLMGDIKTWVMLSAMTLMLNAALGHYNMGKWHNSKQLLIMATDLAQEVLKDAAADEREQERKFESMFKKDDAGKVSSTVNLVSVEMTPISFEDKEKAPLSSIASSFFGCGTKPILKRSYYVRMVYMAILFVLGQVRADEDQVLGQFVHTQSSHAQVESDIETDVSSKRTVSTVAISSDSNAEPMEDNRQTKKRKTERTSLKESLRSLRKCATLAEELLGTDHLVCARIYVLIGRILVAHNHSLGASYAFQAAEAIYNKPLTLPGLDQKRTERSIRLSHGRLVSSSSRDGNSLKDGSEGDQDLEHAALMLETGWAFGASAA